MSGPGSAQLLVRETMIAAGGYWRPPAAVARLLEELGECSELLGAEAGEAGPRTELAGELADLWIITTALADQFLAEVRAPGSGAAGEASLAALLAAAGPIARVVNHYDGPKVPREGAQMPTLTAAIADFHAALAALAAAQGIELEEAVRAKIERIHARGDIERFGRAGFDASTAPLLATLRGERLPERLWAAPWLAHGAGARERAAAAAETLAIFAKAARAERLEGYVIAGPAAIAAAGRGAWAGALIAALDPQGTLERFEVAGVRLRAQALASPGRTLALIQAS